jgi:hypothetical protein
MAARAKTATKAKVNAPTVAPAHMEMAARENVRGKVPEMAGSIVVQVMILMFSERQKTL